MKRKFSRGEIVARCIDWERSIDFSSSDGVPVDLDLYKEGKPALYRIIGDPTGEMLTAKRHVRDAKMDERKVDLPMNFVRLLTAFAFLHMKEKDNVS